MAGTTKRISTNRVLKALVAIVVLAIGAVLLISINQSKRVTDTVQAVSQTENILHHLQKLELAVVDNETNARAFVITGKDVFIDACEESKTRINTELDTLKDQGKDSSIYHLVSDSLSFYISRRIDFTGQMISQMQTNGTKAASALVASGVGKSYTDQVRRISLELQRREAALLEQRKQNNELTILRLSKTLYWVLGISFLLSIGIVLRVRSDMKLINQRRRKEEELRKSEERFRLLINNVKDYAIFMLDPHGHVESWNSGAEHIKGYKAEEIIGQPIDIFYTEEDRRLEEPRFILEMARQYGKFEKDGWRVRKDGSLFWASVIIAAINDDNGQLQGYVKITRDITERKKDQEELEFLSLQLKQANDAIYVTGADLKLKSWNKGAENLYGYTKEEAIGQDPNKLMRTAMSTGQIDAVVTELAEHDYWSGELRRKNKSGKEIYIRSSSTTIRDERGVVTGYVSVNLDISEQKALEQKLKQFNEELEEQVNQKTAELTGLFERITDSFIAVDKDFRYVYINARAGEMIKRNPSELVGKKVTDEYPYIQDTVLYAAMVEAMLTQQPSIIREYYEELNLTLQNHIYPSPDGLSIFIRDITEQTRTEENYRNSEHKYRLLFDNNPMPMWVRSLDDTYIIDVNKAACDAYGYSREEFMQLSTSALRHPDEIDSFMKEFSMQIPSPMNRGIWKHRKKDGTYVDVEIFVQDIIYNDKKSRLILAKDVTKRIKAEEQLRQSYQEIRRLVSHLQNIREEERTNMAREIHDQLGQQLTVMKMDISWLYKRLAEAEKPVKDRVNELKDIMDDTVKLIRRISSDLRPSLLDDMGLLAAVEWHLSEIEKRSGIVIQLTGMKEEPVIPKVAKTNLYRIIQESLTNVGRYAQATKVTVDISRDENELILTISDNGVGFDKEKIADKRTLGILGMRERTSMMGGVYNISSSPGQGTTVLVSIPLTPASSN